MDIGDLSNVMTLFRQALGSFKDAQAALPDGQDAQQAQQKIEDAEKSLQMAEAQAAQELGYHLCKAHWPPEIKLQDRDGMFWCPTCEGTAAEQEAGAGQLSDSKLEILRLLYQAPRAVTA